MPPSSPRSLWSLISAAESAPQRFLADEQTRISVRALDRATSLSVPLETLRGRGVLLATARQLPTVLALAELDGLARRLVLASPELTGDQLRAAMVEAELDVLLTDGVRHAPNLDNGRLTVMTSGSLRANPERTERTTSTEWILFTSGTMGRPKLVSHSLASLAGPLQDGLASAEPAAVWSTFYDVRRYGGLQILLRALIGGGSMVLSAPDEPVATFIARAGAAGVTHISGTPSHWRRALISAAASKMAPRYVRLSGEIADQAILDALKLAWPQAHCAHAFASTEAGVAFDVRDGRAGFPAAMLEPDGVPAQAGIALAVRDGTLRIRSSRMAACYLGSNAKQLQDDDGFVDTGDMVELRDGRWYFVGRREGIINVGGLKVHPEEVEAVINRDPLVRMSRVRARRNPITGAVVAAEVVLDAGGGTVPFPELRERILSACRQALASHKVPATIHAVEALPIAASGKLARSHA